MNEFKIGDYVTIRPDIQSGTYYDGVWVNSDMASLRGRELMIEAYAGDNIYHLNEGGGWTWSPSMFRPVKIRKTISEYEVDVMLTSSSIFLDMMSCE